ncbi:hypothetical protein [Actinophytocola sediminis]
MTYQPANQAGAPQPGYPTQPVPNHHRPRTGRAGLIIGAGTLGLARSTDQIRRICDEL